MWYQFVWLQVVLPLNYVSILWYMAWLRHVLISDLKCSDVIRKCKTIVGSLGELSGFGLGGQSWGNFRLRGINSSNFPFPGWRVKIYHGDHGIWKRKLVPYCLRVVNLILERASKHESTDIFKIAYFSFQWHFGWKSQDIDPP